MAPSDDDEADGVGVTQREMKEETDKLKAAMDEQDEKTDAIIAKMDQLIELLNTTSSTVRQTLLTANHQMRSKSKGAEKSTSNASTSKPASKSYGKTAVITKKTKKVVPSTTQTLKNKPEGTGKRKKTVTKAIPRDGRVKQPLKAKSGAAQSSTVKGMKKEKKKTTIRPSSGAAGVTGGISKGKGSATKGAVAASATSLDDGSDSSEVSDASNEASDDSSEASDDSSDSYSDNFSDPSDYSDNYDYSDPGDYEDAGDDGDEYSDPSYEGADDHQELGW